MKFKLNSNFIISYLLGLFLFIFIFLLIWISGRGFDLTDESFYFIGYYFKIDCNFSVSFFHRIYYQLIGSESLIISRLFRLVFTVLSSFFLGFSVSKFLKFERKFEFGLFVSLFSILSYAWYPPTISYNSLVSILFNIIVSLQFTLFTNNSRITRIILGFFLTLLVLTKFTTILSIILCFGILSVFNKGFTTKSFKNWVIESQFLILGILIAIFSLFKTFDVFLASISSFRKGLNIVEGHALINTLTTQYYGFIHILSHSKYYILAFLILGLLHRSYKFKPNFFILITFIIYLFLLLKFKIITEAIGFFIPYFLFIVFTVFTSLILKIELSKRNIIISFTFFILSFLLSLGTNNSLYVHFIFNSSLLGLSIYIFLYEFPKLYRVLSSVFLIMFISIQFLNHSIYHPYRLNKPIYNQTETLKCRALKNIKVDKEFMTLNDELHVFESHPSHFVFVLADYLGCSLLVNKIPYPFNWLEDKNLKNLDELLTKSKPIREDDLLLILPSTYRLNNKRSYLNESFSKVDINLEKDFKILKSIKYNDDTILIYGAKSIHFVP